MSWALTSLWSMITLPHSPGSVPLSFNWIDSNPFRRLTTGLVERIEVIVRFLALLELFKQGVVELEQAPQSPPAPGAMGVAKAALLRDAMFALSRA